MRTIVPSSVPTHANSAPLYEIAREVAKALPFVSSWLRSCLLYSLYSLSSPYSPAAKRCPFRLNLILQLDIGGQLISDSLIAERRFHTVMEESNELTASWSELSLKDISTTPNVCPSSFNSCCLHISDLKSAFQTLTLSSMSPTATCSPDGLNAKHEILSPKSTYSFCTTELICQLDPSVFCSFLFLSLSRYFVN